jgi:hypothetical protein
MKLCVLGLDIGGATIGWALFPLENDELLYESAASGSVALVKGVAQVTETLSDVFAGAKSEALALGYRITKVGVSAPGHLVGKSGAVISAGSAKQLESRAGEFDNVDVIKLVGKAIDGYVDVVVIGNCAAQMIGVLEAMQPDIPKNRTVMYLGLGERISGGVAIVADDGYELITNGELGDIVVENTTRVSGSAIKKLLNVDPKTLDDNKELRTKHAEAIKALGCGLAARICTITDGDFTHEEGAIAWPDADKLAMRGIKTVLIGGGVGTSPRLGRVIIDAARQELRDRGVEIQFIVAPNETKTIAAYGAALLCV